MLLVTTFSQLSDIPIRKSSAPFTLIPTNHFTIQQLTDVYNQTRVDYMVPMPMSVDKLRQYVYNYDIDLDNSFVAIARGKPVGLAMLGVRGDKTWVTRLGVNPDGREKGIGRSLMNEVISGAGKVGAKTVQLEVIKNNDPAWNLFKSLGFEAWRELLVVRRPPEAVTIDPEYHQWVKEADANKALQLLELRSDTASWVTATESLRNVGDLSALTVDIPQVGSGWLVYHKTPFQLGRVVLDTEADDPFLVATTLLKALHSRYPQLDTVIENLPSDDIHWPAFQSLGYLVTFVRIEMKLSLSPAVAIVPQNYRQPYSKKIFSSSIFSPHRS